MTDKGFKKPVLNALVRGLKDEQHEVRDACTNALGRSGSCALPSLMEAIKDYDYGRPLSDEGFQVTSRWYLFSAIDRILMNTAVSIPERELCAKSVASFLQSRSPEDDAPYLDIWKAGDTLAEHIADRSALSKLIQMAEHMDPRVRRSVAHALGHINDIEATNALRKLSTDSAAEVREEADKSLANVTRKERAKKDIS
jgi:HEAT repeat protein